MLMNSQLSKLLDIQLAHLNKAEFYKELLANTRTNLDSAEQAYRDALKAREVINIVAKETQQQPPQ